MTNQLNNREVYEIFEEEILPCIQAEYEQDGRPDYPARREAFSDFIDSLHRDGFITGEQAQEIEQPEAIC